MSSRMRSGRKNTIRDFPTRRNPVAKHMRNYTRPKVEIDKKKEAKKRGDL